MESLAALGNVVGHLLKERGHTLAVMGRLVRGCMTMPLKC